MIWVKLFEEYSSIDKICKKYRIKNYSIKTDGTVDVDDNVYLHEKNLKELPLKFGKVTGNFDCGNNQLITLEGAPKVVGDNFDCSRNQLTTLEGSPKLVGGSFVCHHNQLTTLEGAPKVVSDAFYCQSNQLITLEGAPKEVGGNFYCYSNKLTTLEGAPKEVGGYFDCRNNQLNALEGAPKVVGGGFDCYNNPLPKEILTFKDKKYILKWQDDYVIWQHGKLNLYRFQEMIKDYDLG
jgi:hypothetical protein